MADTTIYVDFSGSQQERISILRMALAGKGLPLAGGCHQGLDADAQAQGAAAESGPPGQAIEAHTQAINRSTSIAAQSVTDDIVFDEDGGIDL